MSSIQNNGQVTARRDRSGVIAVAITSHVARRDRSGVIAVAITSHVTVEAASYC
jgi:hypothetical protein